MFVILAGCSSTPTVYFALEDLAGTWLNQDYNFLGSSKIPKEIVAVNGVVRGYSQISDTEPHWTYRIVLVQVWPDENGNIWFKCEWEINGGEAEEGKTVEYFGLCKISGSGTIWERCLMKSEYPAELSPIMPRYTFLIRQQEVTPR